MDAEGNVIAKQGDRTVAGFRDTLEAVKAFQDLKARSAKGEKGLDFPLFLAEWELGTLNLEQVKSRIAAMPKLTPKEKAQAEQIAKDAEVQQLASTARDEASLLTVGQSFHDMLAAGYAPGPHAERIFWSLLLRWADMKENLADYEKAVAYMKKAYADEARMAEYLKGLDQRLAELRGKAGAKP